MLTTTNSSSGAVESSVTESSSAPPSGETFDETPESSRRRQRSIAAAVLLAVTGAVGATVVAGADDEPAAEPVDSDVTAVSAETRDLAEFVDLDGRLVDANIEPVAATTEGIVTASMQEGQPVERGDVLVAVNGVPATVFYADVPLYRTLDDGVVGDDVRMLEENLAALGYHTVESDDGEQIDEGFAIDGEFDRATVEAVERWQTDVDADVTGVVSPFDVVVVDGAAVVERTIADLGDRVGVGEPVIELAVNSRVTTTHLEHSGEIELLVEEGVELAAGNVVYAVDDVPVTVLVGDETFDRDLELGVDPGDDVLMLEEMLVAFGYDAGGALQVDDEFDEDTERAIEDWQGDLADWFEEVEIDGQVSVDEVFVVAGGSSVGSIVDHGTVVLAAGSVLWTSESTTVGQVVETSIEVSDRDGLAVGTVIDVQFPDGESVPGTVVDVGDRTTVDATDPDAEAMLSVEIRLDSVPESVATLDEVDVVVKVVDELVAGAVVVPASALIAVGDGPFAVEALTTTGTTLVPVTTGMFSDGWVAVEGLQPGTQVVTP